MSRDQTYGGLILVISLILAVIYLATFLAPWVSIYFSAWPAWLNWWAVAIPVFLLVVAALMICMWIGWTMLTTPLSAPPETEIASTPEAETKEREDKKE